MRNFKNYRNLPYNPELKNLAAEKRKAGILSEVLLWKKLKNKQFKGLDFDRQKIIGNYIVDFFCMNTGTIIEIDGATHKFKGEHDKERDGFMEGLGLNIIHILDKDVLTDIQKVMRMLENHDAFIDIPGSE